MYASFTASVCRANMRSAISPLSNFNNTTPCSSEPHEPIWLNPTTSTGGLRNTMDANDITYTPTSSRAPPPSSGFNCRAPGLKTPLAHRDALTILTSPIMPSSTHFITFLIRGTWRGIIASMRKTFSSLATRTISRASSALMVNAFSHSTALPFRMHITLFSRWNECGVPM